MQPAISTSFFLGADTRFGYYSLYGSLLSSEQCRTQYIIKGGHAQGKSIFINHLATRLLAGDHSVECFRSARDPELLDGIYIPSLSAVFLDGELPHAINAQYPGAVETYIDLGALYDCVGLKNARENIINLTGKLDNACKRLTRYLAAAGEVRDNIAETVRNPKNLAAIKGRAARNAARELSKTGDTGSATYRFLGVSSSDSCDFSSIMAQCDRVSILDNDFGLSSEMLTVLLNRAAALGCGVVACLDPLEPEKLQHLMIPSLSLAYVSKTTHQTFSGEVYKHFRLDALPRESMTPDEKARVKSERKLLASLLDKATDTRADIKHLLAELDGLYAPHLDLDGVAALAERRAKSLF